MSVLACGRTGSALDGDPLGGCRSKPKRSSPTQSEIIWPETPKFVYVVPSFVGPKHHYTRAEFVAVGLSTRRVRTEMLATLPS
jgi:hypothetical protein